MTTTTWTTTADRLLLAATWLLLVLGAVCLLISPWLVGPNSARAFGTGVIALFLAVVPAVTRAVRQ